VVEPSTILLAVLACFPAASPIGFLPADDTIRTLRDAGYVMKGRDPLAGTGACDPLLPANQECDVYYVKLPDGDWHERDLRLLLRLPNLQQIRAERTVTKTELQHLKEIAGSETRVIASIRGTSSTVPILKTIPYYVGSHLPFPTSEGQVADMVIPRIKIAEEPEARPID